ncbi:MAG TPA: RNA 2',3'-cyclic phosphodiesterase [Bacillota bacterium]|mgnify:CR=1 FL=1|nr:RNA 2',3'-cyclic phosphodiesterase [Clostridiales bacterium UBA9856]HOA42529.1 RNA 2',3'-cyclic phosphodiesterase [Bacillota bacterium]HPZ60103.1 RNA 2',3'-cyclic phosphodiesterase [Bacillota bacterium]HQC81786.1 RNA 2',3'-cyclic phosphodiesterase [Bacillota bacterium]
MRAFIGIDFEDNIKDEICSLQQQYREHAIRGRWKHRDNFHITLKFLREVSPKQKAMIDGIMVSICKNHKPFELKLAETGIFGGRGSIRVLWLGLGGDRDALFSLQNEIDLALELVGFQRESRKYSPHVTIGQDILFEEDFETVKQSIPIKQFKPLQVKSLYLFKSEQIQNKRVYTKVSQYDLR